MDIIQSVFNISEEIMNIQPSDVWIKEDVIEDLSEAMKIDGKPSFFNNEYQTGIYIDILKELVASSINYCYWYGASTIRPNNASSTKMYEIVEEAFGDAKTTALNLDRRINYIIKMLSTSRFPLLEERKGHLLELLEGRKGERFARMVSKKEYAPDRLFYEMIEMFQGFASDIFLKRASLFFIQLYRKFGWYEDDLMTILHVPADYQVPKILKHFNCIEYGETLENIISLEQLIPKNSILELQIRAATVIACTKLQYKTGWTIADVDTYLWTKRKLTDEPFHLTITTDY